MPKEKADAAVYGAQVLINIGNQTAYQLPSKILQYVASGRPILNFYSIDNDSSKNFLKPYDPALHLKFKESGTVSEHDVQEVLSFLKKQLHLGFDNPVPNWIERYKVTTVAQQYLDLIKECRDKSRSSNSK